MRSRRASTTMSGIVIAVSLVGICALAILGPTVFGPELTDTRFDFGATATAALDTDATRVATNPSADAKYAARARRAGEVIAELTRVPDHAPPVSLLEQATCIAVVPHMVEAGLGFGGKVGFGLVSCRTPVGWSLPAFMGLKGGSFGLQLGGEAADVVLVFVNDDAGEQIGRSTFDLGAEASLAAGPVGRELNAAADYRAQAEIYAYSKAKGLFGGLALTGTKWEIDDDANRAVYGSTRVFATSTERPLAARLLEAPADGAPATVRPFLDSLVGHVDRGAAK
jgi:lipid-binding SYLF domain-containing protein